MYPKTQEGQYQRHRLTADEQKDKESKRQAQVISAVLAPVMASSTGKPSTKLTILVSQQGNANKRVSTTLDINKDNTLKTVYDHNDMKKANGPHTWSDADLVHLRARQVKACEGQVGQPRQHENLQ